MNVYLIMICGGDCFENNWSTPIEVFSTLELAQSRVHELDCFALEKELDVGYKILTLELDKITTRPGYCA